MEDFTHLHLHSTYSLMDGIIKIDELCQQVKKLGMSSCALTDHGNLHGMIEFYKEAKKTGIKPILGVEAYLTRDPNGTEKKTRDNYHAVLLAQNNTGLENIITLTNRANAENFYYNPRINIEDLYSLNDGIILSTACLGGVISRQGRSGVEKIKRADRPKWKLFEDEALAQALEMRDIFSDRFYLEIQDNGLWEQEILNEFLVQIGRAHKIPLVITADAHFLKQEDYSTHQMIMAKQLGMSLKEYSQKGDMVYSDQLYVKPPQEMFKAAARIGNAEAFFNTVDIANRCEVEIELGKFEIPEFKVEETEDYEEFLAWRNR